jgi:predicted anti-sigma-YlaC factor YlaD
LEQLGEFLDEDARAELCREIQVHLDRCPDCRIYVDTVKKTIVLYQNGASPEMPVAANARLQTALAREYRLNPHAGGD